MTKLLIQMCNPYRDMTQINNHIDQGDPIVWGRYRCSDHGSEAQTNVRIQKQNPTIFCLSGTARKHPGLWDGGSRSLRFSRPWCKSESRPPSIINRQLQRRYPGQSVALFGHSIMFRDMEKVQYRYSNGFRTMGERWDGQQMAMAQCLTGSCNSVLSGATTSRQGTQSVV